MTPSRKVTCSIWGRAGRRVERAPKINECPECTEQERGAGERDEPGALRWGGLPERATNGWRGGPEQLQGKGQIGRGLKTTGRLLLQAASNNLGDGGRDFVGQWRGILVEDGMAAFDQGAAGEWPLTGEHLVQHGSETEDVRPRVDVLAPDLFWRHVGWSSDDGASLRPPARWGNGVVENPV